MDSKFPDLEDLSGEHLECAHIPEESYCRSSHDVCLGYGWRLPGEVNEWVRYRGLSTCCCRGCGVCEVVRLGSFLWSVDRLVTAARSTTTAVVGARILLLFFFIVVVVVS